MKNPIPISTLVEWYKQVRARVVDAGYRDEIKWANNVQAPENAEALAVEAIFVICNSGMKATVARPIFERIMTVLREGGSAHRVFGHTGKSEAINRIWGRREVLLIEFQSAEDKVQWCEGLPFIGGITKYHLARNLGVQVAKPDRHLLRIATWAGRSVEVLCADLAAVTQDKVGAVDVVLWRASERGIIDSNSPAVINRELCSGGEA